MHMIVKEIYELVQNVGWQILHNSIFTFVSSLFVVFNF